MSHLLLYNRQGQAAVYHVVHDMAVAKAVNREHPQIPAAGIHGRKLKPMLQSLPRQSELVFLMPKGTKVCPKKLLRHLKNLCRQCGSANPNQYKLHTFRHFFASYCAQQSLSYKYVLEWMGHSSSDVLDLYFTMNDRQAQAAMNSLSFNSEKAESRTIPRQSGSHSEPPPVQVSHV